MTDTMQALFSKPFVTPETYDAFFAVVDRLETTLSWEAKAITMLETIELAELTRQKRQGFLELNRIMKSLDQMLPSQTIIDRLATFRGKLAENGALIETYLKATQEVTNIIVRAMRDAESDGTYSSTIEASRYDFA